MEIVERILTSCWLEVCLRLNWELRLLRLRWSDGIARGLDGHLRLLLLLILLLDLVFNLWLRWCELWIIEQIHDALVVRFYWLLCENRIGLCMLRE